MTNTETMNKPMATELPWWKEPTRDQWITLTTAWAGWCLDMFDYFLMILVLGDIAKAFDVNLVTLGTVIFGTLICRLIGGVLFGTWGDRVGRKLPLMVSIAVFTIFSGASGLAPTFVWFFAFRLLFGFGMGGEWAAGTPLAMESWPQRSRGIASGLLQGGYPCGYFLATVAYYLVYPLWGWRVLFLIGVLPAALLFIIRFWVKESPVFEERQAALKAAGKKDTSISVIRLFERDKIGTTIHVFVLMSFCGLSQYSMATLWPTYLTNELHVTIGEKTLFLIMLNVGSLLGYWAAGAFSELVGRRIALSVFAVLGTLVIPLYCMSSDFTLVLIGGTLEGFFAVGYWGVIPAYLSERFPTSVRGVGPGAALSVNGAIGATAPTIQALMIQDGGFSIGHSIGLSMGVSLVLVAVLVFLGPEPKGRAFTADV